MRRGGDIFAVLLAAGCLLGAPPAQAADPLMGQEPTTRAAPSSAALAAATHYVNKRCAERKSPCTMRWTGRYWPGAQGTTFGFAGSGCSVAVTVRKGGKGWIVSSAKWVCEK